MEKQKGRYHFIAATAPDPLQALQILQESLLTNEDFRIAARGYNLIQFQVLQLMQPSTIAGQVKVSFMAVGLLERSSMYVADSGELDEG